MKLAVPLMLAAALAVGALTAIQYGPGTLVPERRVPDTSHLNVFLVDTLLMDVLRDSVRHYTAQRREVAFCLYAEVHTDTLLVTSANRGLGLWSTDSTSLFTCAKWPGYVGDLHSHIESYSDACLPSLQDKRRFAVVFPDMLLFYVLCDNGIAYLQVRDGRWWWMTW